MQPEPPQPVWATWKPSTKDIHVRFDRPLQAVPVLDPTNWSLTALPAQMHIGIVIQARGSSVFGRMQPWLAGPLPGTCTYAPPPFDVLGRLGGIAPAFANFPITILP